MSPKKISQLSLNAGFMSSILHLLPLIYPILYLPIWIRISTGILNTDTDPHSRKVLNTDSI